MPNFTPYEKRMWFNKYGDFDGDIDFLSRGDELGEAFDILLAVDEYSTYLSKEIVEMAQREMLDMYYDQMHLYDGTYGGADEPEDLGLPPRDQVTERMIRYIEFGIDGDTAFQMTFDWAMRWRKKNASEFFKKQRRERLHQELAELDG